MRQEDKTDWSRFTFHDVPPLEDLYCEGDPPVLLIRCPTCKAEEGQYCLSGITGKTRKVPCNARLKLAGV